MTTELVDANTTQAPATVDAQEFARAMARELAQNLNQSKEPAKAADEIAEVVAQLKAAGVEDSDIQAHISTALGLDKKLSRIVKETEEKATKQIFQTMQNKELNGTISRVMRSYSKDDDLITEAAPAIREKALSEFINGSSASLVTARNRFFNTGDLDEDVIDEIIGRHVKRFEQAADKRTGKKKDATPNLKPSDTSARPSTPGDGNLPDAGNLTELQQRAYDMVMRANARSPRPGVTLDAIKQKALACAAAVRK